jgi:hypothetical protein
MSAVALPAVAISQRQSGWDGRIRPAKFHQWVGTCLSCYASAGQERAFGIDGSGKLVNVEAFRLDDEPPSFRAT